MKTALFMLISISLTSCFDLDPGQVILLEVNGGRFHLIHRDQSGGLINDSGITRWEYSYNASAGDYVFIYVINESIESEMSVRIYRDGKPWETLATDKQHTDTLRFERKIPLFN